MRYKTSILALLLGLGIYGAGPVVAKYTFLGASPALADSGESEGGGDSGGDGGNGGGGDDDNGGLGGGGDSQDGVGDNSADLSGDAGSGTDTASDQCKNQVCEQLQ